MIGTELSMEEKLERRNDAWSEAYFALDKIFYVLQKKDIDFKTKLKTIQFISEVGLFQSKIALSPGGISDKDSHHYLSELLNEYTDVVGLSGYIWHD